jgi:hypothetical protein
MDSMGVSEALDSGSIPDEATSKILSQRLRILSLQVLKFKKFRVALVGLFTH